MLLQPFVASMTATSVLLVSVRVEPCRHHSLTVREPSDLVLESSSHRRVPHLECRRFDLSCAVVVAVVLCTVGSNIRKPLSHCLVKPPPPCSCVNTITVLL
ncbi:hypothetical protein V6N12_049256 [Hibiscus sabdariffa]|uniref:Secreted protein n=1 Tax=Hibiscus sabdariffa TaxID=183260 RepID=A0ABR2EJN9_9ROSI